MIVKVTSTQTKDFLNYSDNGGKPYYIKDLSTLPANEQKSYINYLKINQAAKLLKYEIIRG
jgi:hypothetical protein